MMRNKVVAATVGAALTLTGLAGCSSPPASTTTSVKSLTVLDYYASEPTKTIVQGLLDSCATSSGVTLDHTSVPGADLIQKVLQQASSKTLPDVLMLDNPDVQQIAATGALTPLGDLGLTGDGYIPGAISASTYNGKLYGLQPTANTLAILYNKDIFDKAGAKVPTTWAELRSVAKSLTTADRYGFAFSAAATYEGAFQFLPAMWSNGGDETNLKSPEVADALQFWKQFVDDGSASKSVVTWAQNDARDQFVAGKAAMMLNGPWQISTLKSKGVNFGVMSFPVNKAGQASVTPLGGEAWTVPATGDKSRMTKAAELVKCMNSDENQVKRAKASWQVPTKTALAAAFAKDVPEMATFVEAVGRARARTGKVGDKWPTVAKTIYTGMQLTLTGQAAPADAMAKAGG